MVRKRLVLDQIPILWKVKCSGEREEMDSHLEHLWSFYFELLISTLLSGGMGLVSFFSLHQLLFFKEDDPHSMSIELLEGSIAWIDHSRWIGSL